MSAQKGPGGPYSTMQLTLLQTRLAASLAASIVVVILYLLLVAPTGALAADLPEVYPADTGADYASELQFGESYEPEFSPFDRSIIGRAPLDVIPLKNNEVKELNVERGTTVCYSLAKSVVFGSNEARGLNINGGDDDDADSFSNLGSSDAQNISRRQEPEAKKIYISVNTCLQPGRVEGDEGNGDEPPQLRLVVANSTELGCPDASKEDSPGYVTKELDGGAVMYSMNFTDDIYIGISAPNVTDDFDGVYAFEVAISTDDYYHRYESEEGQRELLWLDSDYSSALLVSKNLTTNSDKAKEFMDESPPYEIYLDNEEFPRFHGLSHSRCGIAKHPLIAANIQGIGQDSELVRTIMTTRGPGGFPKQQFYVTGLNSSTNYSGVLVKPGNSSTKGKREDGMVGGGGTVFQSTNFQTLSGKIY